MFPPTLINQVRGELLGVVQEHVQLKKSNAAWIGKCPFHADDKPSFRVNPTGRYHCFGCQASGDAIDFLRAIEHLTFPEAVRRLADRAGIPIETETPLQRDEYRRRRIVAQEIADECAYWVSIGGFARAMRQAMLPAVEVEAYEWCAANPGGPAEKWEAAWAVLAAADQGAWDRCNAAIRDASGAEVMEAYLKFRTPEFRRLYREYVAAREVDEVHARRVCREVVGVMAG